jgi:TRAP-type C4-dicarboxylate transport system substrate-binding protein
MKKKHTILCVVISLAVLLLIGGRAIAAGEIKLALDCPPDPEKCGTYLWSKTFADDLDSKGVKVKLYTKDALGGEAEKLDQVSQGLLEISNSDLAKAGSLDPTIFGFYLPFLFEDMDHFFPGTQKHGYFSQNQCRDDQTRRARTIADTCGRHGRYRHHQKIR